MNIYQSEAGSVNPLVVSNIIVGIIAIGLAGVSIWAYMNYTDQKDNVDSKIETAVVAAKAEQLAADEKDFIEKEKLPTRTFVGPDDLGRVSFQYPKTWSVYVDSDGGSGSYEAYLNPGVVPPVSNTQPFAVRVIVENDEYADTIKSFDRKVSTGELKSAPITVGEFTGIRLTGTFSKDRKGSMVIFKVRDKTLIVASDAEAFRKDFDSIIVKTLTFNP